NPTDHQPGATSGYNSRNPSMLLPSRPRLIYAIAVFLLSSVAHATDWRPLIAQLSSKIAAATGPGVVALDVTNRSLIGASKGEGIRRDLVSSLASPGVRVWQPEQAAGFVKVTLSESLQNYVWVAEVREGTDEPAIFLVSLARPESGVVAQNALPV